MELSDVRYYADALVRSNEQISGLRTKMFHDITSLSIVDLYVLRENLIENWALSINFQQEVRIEETKKKKKFFRRK